MKKQILWLSLFCCIAFGAFNAYADFSDSIDIHGFVSQGYLTSDKNNYLADTEDGTFDFNEFGINFSTEFDKLRIGIQMISRDLGDFGNNEPKVDWAVADYHLRDEFGVQFGKIKMPLGLYNQGRDIDLLRIPVLLPGSVYDEGARDFQNSYQGGSIYGVLNYSGLGMFNYEFFVGNIKVNSDSIYIRGQKELIGTLLPGDNSVPGLTITSKYLAGGSLQWNTPLDGLRLGYTYNRGKMDIIGKIASETLVLMGLGDSTSFISDVKKRENWVASVEYSYNEFTVAFEFSQTDTHVVSQLPALGATDDTTLEAEGWYIQSTYRFTDAIAAGIYYSEFYPDRNDKDGEGYSAVDLSHYAWQKEIVPTVRFDITDTLEIKGEVHFVDGTAQVYKFNNPGGRDKDWTLYALKATLCF